MGISIKDLTPEQREAAVALFVAEQSKVNAKDERRISRILNPAGWTISVNTTDNGVTYLSCHNQSCHGNTKGWGFRGMTLPLITGSRPADGNFPKSGSPYLVDELRAWESEVGDKLTK